MDELAVEGEDVGDVALQRSAAAAEIVSNTGCTSVGDWLITRRISLVAVCCSSASVSSRLRAELGEQAHVLDGDDRLVGEGLAGARLVCREKPGFRSADGDRADRASFAHERYGEHAAKARGDCGVIASP